MKDAGIDDLKVFKHFNLIDNLSKGVTDYENFLKCKTDSIYMKLLRDQEIAKIQKELERIRKRKLQ